MSIIKINNEEPCEWLYGQNEIWKDYVHENFDETFVITGNRHSTSIEDASWYKNAVSICKDIQAYEPDELDETVYNITKEQLEKIIKIYNDDRFDDGQLSNIKKIVEIMNPDDTFVATSISGYSQGDWQNVLYKSTNTDDSIKDRLETYYFGKLSEIIIEDDNGEIMVDCISHDALWEKERNNTLKESLCNDYDVNIDNATFMVSDGVITTVKYKEF